MSGNRALWATSRFEKDLNYYIRNYPQVSDTFREFAEFRQSSDHMSGFGRKDAVLKGCLSGTWHCHIVYGEVLLFYGIDDKNLKLYRMLGHDYVDDSDKQKSLASYIDKLTYSDFYPYTFPVVYEQRPPVPTVSSESVKQALWHLATCPNDRICMVNAVNGDAYELMVLLAVWCDREDIDPQEFGNDASNALGGPEKFIAELKTILEQTNGQDS